MLAQRSRTGQDHVAGTVMVLHRGDVNLINQRRRESTTWVGARVPVAGSTVSDDCSV
jgi:hypothetical protein